MKKLKIIIASFALIVAGSLTGVVATTQPAYAACNPDQRFLTIPTWYRGIVNTSTCDLLPVGTGSGKIPLQNYIWAIVLNWVEIALQIVVYITVFMILFGGFQFLTNGGEAAKAAKARQTIITAMIGLGVSSIVIGIVNLLFRLIVL